MPASRSSCPTCSTWPSAGCSLPTRLRWTPASSCRRSPSCCPRTACVVDDDSGDDDNLHDNGAKGVFIRPSVEVVGGRALLPDANLIRPGPNSFTHELISDQPYWYED